MEIIIRPARPEDVPRMAELLTELFSIESDFTPDRKKQERGLRALLSEPSGASLVIVACADEAVVGMATVQTLVSTSEGGRVGLVEDVIVQKEFRAEGIGTRLLHEAVSWARRRGLRRLQLLADRNNRPALAFYTRNGWSNTELLCRRKML